MNSSKNRIFLGDTPLKKMEKDVRGAYVDLLGEPFYKITNFDALTPFFMTIVSGSDHWLFISSNGAIPTGRYSLTTPRIKSPTAVRTRVAKSFCWSACQHGPASGSPSLTISKVNTLPFATCIKTSAGQPSYLKKATLTWV